MVEASTTEHAARKQQATDSRHEAIKAAADTLAEIGYTRDSDLCHMHQSEVAAVARAMILRYVDLGDTSSAFEFLTEASAATDEGFLRKLADVILGGSAYQTAFAHCAETRARWYAESFIREALDLLPSASEIERDRKIDMDIDERKSA